MPSQSVRAICGAVTSGTNSSNTKVQITGDHAGTAAAIAAQIGLDDSPSNAPAENVITGRMLADLSDTELLDAAEKTAVFARVAPEQKLRLVNYLFNCRSLSLSILTIGVFSNRWLLAGVGTMTVLQLAFTYVPAMNRVFSTAPIGFTEWWWILSTATLIYRAVGTEKWLRQRGTEGTP